MLINTHRNTVERLAFNAAGSDIDQHGQRSWALHGDCQFPVWRHIVGRPDKLLSDPVTGYGVKFTMEPRKAVAGWATFRCRKCERCKVAKARHWAARAVTEVQAANRTWFVTLTVRPDERVRILYKAQLAMSAGGTDWQSLNPAQRFAELSSGLGDEVTRFLKRVRKNTDAKLRYICTFEMHKDGFPHVHLLLHEWNEGGEAPKAVKRKLEAAWKFGFSKFKLCDRSPKTAWYVCKYITKAPLSRTRASQEYGPAAFRRVAERLIDARRTIERVAEKRAQKERDVCEAKDNCLEKGPLLGD